MWYYIFMLLFSIATCWVAVLKIGKIKTIIATTSTALIFAVTVFGNVIETKWIQLVFLMAVYPMLVFIQWINLEEEFRPIVEAEEKDLQKKDSDEVVDPWE